MSSPSTAPIQADSDRLSKPIADYGLLADCNSAALVARDGSIDWLCLPRYDSGAIFARILDPDAGHWLIRPAGDVRERAPLPAGVARHRDDLQDASGAVRLVDAMAAAPGQRGHDLGFDAPHELLRSGRGRQPARWSCVTEIAVRPEFGLVRPLVRLEDGGARTFGADPVAVAPACRWRWRTSTMRAAFTVAAGERVGFSMRWSSGTARERPQATPAADVADRIADTVEAWRSWEAEHDVYDGPHRELVRHSSRVLKGLTYRPTGAIVAAPTTSLPETVGGERNWDYRFSWIRDSSLTIEALYIGACSDEAEEFVSFMTSAAGGRASERSLQIMYGIGGEHDLSERTLGHLRGWRDSSPVRVGNGAWDQTQLDVYGELLELAVAVLRAPRRAAPRDPGVRGRPGGHRRAALAREGLRHLGDARRAAAPPVVQGHVLDRAGPGGQARTAARRLRQGGGSGRPSATGSARRSCERGWSEKRQAFAQSFDSDELDAAALLMPIYGFLPATDERMRSTIEAIARDLTEDGLVLRYRNVEGLNADGLSGEEGTFVICTFWLVSSLAQAGEVERAAALLEQLAGYANDLGLLAEEIDTANGEQLGNFPQAYSHIGLITAASQVDNARGAIA